MLVVGLPYLFWSPFKQKLRVYIFIDLDGARGKRSSDKFLFRMWKII